MIAGPSWSPLQQYIVHHSAPVKHNRSIGDLKPVFIIKIYNKYIIYWYSWFKHKLEKIKRVQGLSTQA